MSTPRKNRGRNGSRKFGRNEAKCKAYRASKRREKNKIRKLNKLLRKQPNNAQIKQAIKKWESCL